ncbi:uncharacterized protein LOC122976658 [Scomber scombrus]|uniref:Uncharacterized protein LOC122976658 n=1 Tax=Scomber scombrus TaxID=13677 RepID=A0AAV1PX93_SCOSC
MAGLCWVVVGLAVFLSAENGLAAVDQNKLARIVDAILKEYGRHAMFSLAIRIPDNQNQNINQILKQVFKSDPGNDVKKKINNGEVYIGSRVIAAKVLKRSKGSTDNAESRVVDHLYHFTNRCNPNTKDMLLFYVYSSPCVEQRSNRHNILRRIKNIQRWNSFAVVFSGIYRPRDGLPSTDQQRRGALQLLGMSIGLNNIFRCHGPCGRMKCSCCSCGTQVVDYCVLDDTKLSTASIQPNGSNRKNNFGNGATVKGLTIVLLFSLKKPVLSDCVHCSNTLTLRRQQKNWTTSEHHSDVLLQKMANLLCITVTLVFLLSAGCLAVVDQNRLRGLILQIKNMRKDIPGMYSVAVSVTDQQSYNLPATLPSKEDKDKINNGLVYNDDKLIVAKRKPPRTCRVACFGTC